MPSQYYFSKDNNEVFKNYCFLRDYSRRQDKSPFLKICWKLVHEGEIYAFQSDLSSSDESKYIHVHVFGLSVLLSRYSCRKIIFNWIVG